MSQTAIAGWIVVTLAIAHATQPAPTTGQISGRVLDDATYQPLADARVFLYSIPFPDGGRPAATVTGPDGEFVFPQVQPGSYSLGTNKRGFFATRGITVDQLGPGEQASIALTMARGGVLAGTVVDPSGKPMANAWVGALRVVGLMEFEQTIPSPDTARTNLAGEFRVEGLQPGEYVLVANPGYASRVRAAGRPDALVFFPGTMVFANARRVALGPAQIVSDLDFRIITPPTFEVSGIAVDDSGRALTDVLVTLVADWKKFGGRKGSSRTDSAGRFSIPDIAVGHYRLVATSGGELQGMGRDMRSVRVTVTDADVSGLAVPVSSPRVPFEGGDRMVEVPRTAPLP